MPLVGNNRQGIYIPGDLQARHVKYVPNQIKSNQIINSSIVEKIGPGVLLMGVVVGSYILHGLASLILSCRQVGFRLFPGRAVVAVLVQFKAPM